MRRRTALAGALGACSAIVAYAAIRVVGSFAGVEPDPRGIYWTEHAGFSWRALTALLFGGLLTLTAAQLDEERLDRWVLPGVLGATLAIVLQAIFLP